MTRERLDNWCERGIVGLVLVVLVFGPLATGAVRPLEFLIIQGLTISAALLWLLRFWLNPGYRLLWSPICWIVIAFVVYAIIRYQQADLEYVARQELIRILVYAFLFLIVLNNLTRQESAQLITFIMIFLGMAVSIYAIYQFATSSEYVWHFIKPAGYRKRGSGTYICPNHLAGFLEILLPVGLSFALTSRLGHVLRILLGYASLVILAGIGVTISRGGWLATIVTLFLFFICLIRRRQFRIPALVAALLLVGLVTAFCFKTGQVQKRFDEILSAEAPNSAETRFRLWRPTFRMWQDHFWLGVGPDHFDYRFPLYRPPEVQLRPGHAHNDYLNTLADWGVIGAVIVALAFALLYSGVFKTLKFVRRQESDLGTKPSNRVAFVLGASLGLAAILIHSLTDFNMHVPANAILVVTLMALLAGHLRFATERYWVSLSVSRRVIATFIGLLGMIFLGQQIQRRAHEYVCLERAAKQTAYTHKMISALEEAAAIEPTNFETTYALGEALRRSGWDADNGSKKLIVDAREWFQKGIRLNPYDPYNFMRIGMCLDWQGTHGDAAPYYEKALSLDPNNFYLIAHQGWHFVQTGDYAAAKQLFERSRKLEVTDRNTIAPRYLSIIERKLKETNSSK